MKSRSTKQRILYLRIFVVSLILTIAAGWILTDFLGRVAEKQFKEAVDREAHLIVSNLHDKLGGVENAVKSLSPADAIVAALSSNSPADLGRANRLLDRTNSSFEMSVCYLLDRSGLTVASSNRNEKNGFVGKSFAVRPFVKDALAGRTSTYFALGLLTRERGYFVAAPVVNRQGTITGVVAVKRNIAPLGEFFRKYTHAFLVSPEGIIFISSRANLLYRSLWPVAESRRAELLASKQFGQISFEPLLAGEPRNGAYVRFDNEDLYMQRLPFGRDGWSLVLMEPPRIVADYRMFGILLTIAFAILLLFFYTVLRYKNNSLEAARDLLKARDNWKRTFDTVPDLIAMIDTNCRITNINWAMAERLGISPGEAVGRRCYELLHGAQEPPPSCPHQRMLESGETESESLFEKNLNGDFIVTTSPVLNEDGTIESSVHVMHDVTEVKRLSEEVNRIHNLESIGLLAGGLAHDFNNILNIIYGNLTFVKMMTVGNTAIIEPLADAEEACERAKELGLRLQAFSQGGAPVKEQLPLSAIVEEVAGTLLKGSHISHAIATSDDLLPLEADPRQIRQVFEGLLTNAKEALTAGGTVKIDIDNYLVGGNNGLPLGSGRYLRVAFQDNGPGIPHEHLPKIFDPYFSTKDTYSQRGMGLGLSTCHAILKRHSGHISVESELGIGTRVTLYLPASVEETKLSSEGTGTL